MTIITHVLFSPHICNTLYTVTYINDTCGAELDSADLFTLKANIFYMIEVRTH